MEITDLILIGVIGFLLFLVFRNPKQKYDADARELAKDIAQITGVVKILSENMNVLSERVDKRLKENISVIQRSHRSIDERLENSQKAYTDVKGQLAKLEEAGKRIFDVGKDISELQDTLKAPKLRGVLGELYLEELLKDRFTKDQYTMQYTFKSGQTVDAVIRLRDGKMVPIDSKFSLENFKKLISKEDEDAKKKAKKAFLADIKKRIDEIANKYIVPDEGTLNFALMYIPAENVYYEVIVRYDAEQSSIMEYALGRGVFPVSPNTFSIYLTTILSGLRGLEIEKRAEEIMAYLSTLRIDFGKFSEEFNLIGTHLSHAKNSYERSDKKLGKFQDKLGAIDSSDSKALKKAEK